MKSIKNTILLIFIASSISVSFASEYASLLKEFETESKTKEAHLNRYLELSRTFIDLMTIYGNEYFRQSKNANSELYSFLKYDPEKNSYNLDAVAGTKYEGSTGNLTGTGKIPQKGINRDEMNLALRYNEFVIILFDRAYEEAMATAEKIRKKVEILAIHCGDPIELKGTMTFGVTEYNYNDSIDECVSKADRVLYLGKENGRNQVNGYKDGETV